MSNPKKSNEAYAWQPLEDWLFESECKTFTVQQAAAGTGLPAERVSVLLAAYQAATLKAHKNTLFVLTRHGRARGSSWEVGHGQKQFNQTRLQFQDDVKHRLLNAVEPILSEMAQRTPRLRRQYTDTLVEIGQLLERLATLAGDE